MANTKKMTKRDYFNLLLDIPAVAENDELVDFVNHEIELLTRKNSAERKPSKKQIEQKNHDEELRSIIVESMEVDRLYSADEIAKSFPALVAEDITAPKVSYLMRDLVTTNKVTKETDKRKVYYKIRVVEG